MTQLVHATTITEVRDHLLQGFNALVNKEMEPKEMQEINNTAGKIIASVKVQLEYHGMRGEKPEIDFLNSPPTHKTIATDQPKLDKPKK